MEPANYDLTIYRDRDFSKTFYFKTLGEAMDLTGYTGKAEIRENKDAAALIVAFQVTIDPLIGSICISLTDTQTMLLPDGVTCLGLGFDRSPWGSPELYRGPSEGCGHRNPG